MIRFGLHRLTRTPGIVPGNPAQETAQWQA
jgi:hypothetical protein